MIYFPDYASAMVAGAEKESMKRKLLRKMDGVLMRTLGCIDDKLTACGAAIQDLRTAHDVQSAEVCALREDNRALAANVAACRALLQQLTKPKVRRQLRLSRKAQDVAYETWQRYRNSVDVKSRFAAKDHRITYCDVFEYTKHTLARVGIVSVEQFKAAITSVKVRKCRD